MLRKSCYVSACAVTIIRCREKIIDAARRLGFDAPQSCRAGNAIFCVVNLISGKVRQRSDIF